MDNCCSDDDAHFRNKFLKYGDIKPEIGLQPYEISCFVQKSDGRLQEVEASKCLNTAYLNFSKEISKQSSKIIIDVCCKLLVFAQYSKVF